MVVLIRGLLILAGLLAFGSTAALAASDAEKRKLMLPAIRAATDCIVAAVAADASVPSPPTLPSIARPIERALTGRACASEVQRMVEKHDQVYGAWTGVPFMQGAYASDLPQTVLNRLKSKAAATNNPAGAASPSAASARIDAQPARRTLQTAPSGSGRAIGSTEAAPAQGVRAQVTDASKITGEYISLFLVALGASFTVLFILGLGSRFVVFADEDDLMMTACIFFVPIGTVLGLLAVGFVYSLGGPIKNLPIWESMTVYPAFAITLGVGALAWAWAILGTLASSIRYNGLIFGTLIAGMKVMAGAAMGLAWFGSLHAFGGESRSDSIMKLLFLGLLIWFASKLINGDRVIYGREYRAQMLAAAQSNNLIDA